MQDSKIPLKNGYMIINNDFIGNPGIHWITCIIKDKNFYIYDSFGRSGKNILPKLCTSMKGRGYNIINTDTDQDQYGIKSVDCGHRCISALQICDKFGLPAFLSL